jgi:hypothetical protein
VNAPASAAQVAVLAEALAGALFMVAESPPGTNQNSEAVAQSRDLYLKLGPYLLTEAERSGFPPTDLLHKE